MLGEAQQFVSQWHKAMNIDFKADLDDTYDVPDLLNCTLVSMKATSKFLLERFKSTDDLRDLRFHLVLEEVSEMIEAMTLGDDLNALDGLCDAVFVLIGTGVSYNWNLDGAFREVCKSNALKKPAQDCPRLSDKGKKFSPPDLRRFI